MHMPRESIPLPPGRQDQADMLRHGLASMDGALSEPLTYLAAGTCLQGHQGGSQGCAVCLSHAGAPGC